MKKTHVKTMVRRLLQTSILLCLVALAGCRSDEEMSNGLSPESRFFAYNGKTDLTQQVLSVLQDKNDTLPFVDKFVEKYGYPLWNNAVDVYEGNGATLYVPVHKQGEREIESIWVFSVDPPTLNYGLMKRSEVGMDFLWRFDYFTQEALHRKPKSGMVIKPIVDTSFVSTRAYITYTKCNEIWTGSSMDELEYQYTDCWTHTEYIPDGFSTTGDGSSGSCSSCLAHWKMADFGSGGGGTTGSNPTPQTPCEQVKRQLQDSLFTTKIKGMREYLTITEAKHQREKGFREDRGKGYTPLVANGSTSLYFDNNEKTVGYLHNHTAAFEIDLGLGYYKEFSPIQIFSPADIIVFLQMVRSAANNGIPVEDVYATVVAKDGTYMLKFTGNPKDIGRLPSPNALEKEYKYYFTQKYPNSVVEAFLHFVNDRIPVLGIELMGIDFGNHTSTLTLDDKEGKVLSIDCD